MRRVPAVLFVLVALAVCAVAAYVVVHGSPVKGAGDMPQPPTSAEPTLSSVPGTATPSTDSANGAPPVVAFLGDDWTAGIGASAKSMRFTTLVSKKLHIHERNFGVDGSGYAAASSNNQQYGARVDQIVKAQPQVVVVSGGRNDVVQDDVGDAATKATALFKRLHTALPDATLVAIAPMWGDSVPPSGLGDLAKAVEKAVTGVGGTYVAVADPIRGHSDYMANDADPGDTGYAAIARAVEKRLAPLLPS